MQHKIWKTVENFGGDPQSTMLFNIVLEAVFRDSKIPTEEIIYHGKQPE
jgi:hypothetical protein